MRTYNDMFRPAYETVATAGWSANALASVLLQPPFWPVCLGVSAAMATWRAWQAKELYQFRLSVSAYRAQVITMDELLRISNACLKGRQPSFWIGYGYQWNQKHAEIASRIMARNPDEIYTELPAWMPPALVRYLTPKDSSQIQGEEIGVPWIHGMEPKDAPVKFSLESMAGHTGIVGTTGSGKTRMYELICSQIIHAKKVLLCFDPKGDKDWEQRLRAECKRAGRKFLYFHPAYPSKSIRINPLANWNNISEAATRIGQLVDADGSFAAFAWKTLARVMRGQVAAGDKPTIRSVKRYAQMGIEAQLESLLTKYFYDRDGAGWDRDLMTKSGGKQLPRLDCMVQKYKDEAKTEDEAIEGLIAIFRHSKEHYSKMVQVLEPILEMLGSGELGDMLSPDPTNIEDARPIYDMRKIIEEGAVLYVGLDSLSDKIIGSAIGSILLADLASVAGAIYNFSEKKDVYIVIDEAAEVLNEQTIQILNKGRGAGFKAFLAFQTDADFVVRLGTKEKARQALGNLNNMLCLRIKDLDCAEWVAKSFGKTLVRSDSTSFSTGSESSSNFTEFRGQTSRQMAEKEAYLVSPELLTRLPGLQFFAFIGGKASKVRLPLIQPPNLH
jgi:conjugal transfer pilus assembly protein TraD